MHDFRGYYLFPSLCPSIMQINEDLLGEIEFLSQTGPFSIPVRCLTKKCLVSVDETEVDFGPVCVGETVCKQVTISNSGALSTEFWFAAVVEKPSLQVYVCMSVCMDVHGFQTTCTLYSWLYMCLGDGGRGLMRE